MVIKVPFAQFFARDISVIAYTFLTLNHIAMFGRRHFGWAQAAPAKYERDLWEVNGILIILRHGENELINNENLFSKQYSTSSWIVRFMGWVLFKVRQRLSFAFRFKAIGIFSWDIVN